MIVGPLQPTGGVAAAVRTPTQPGRCAAPWVADRRNRRQIPPVQRPLRLTGSRCAVGFQYPNRTPRAVKASGALRPALTACTSSETRMQTRRTV